MRKRRTAAICRNAPSTIDPVVKLWLLRILVPLGAQRNGMRRGALRIEQLSEIFLQRGLDGDEEDGADEHRIAVRLRQLHREMEGTVPEFDGHGTFSRNLDRLATLTPGDFAAVARRQRFLALSSAEVFVAALEKECAMKEVRPTAMGFLRTARWFEPGAMGMGRCQRGHRSESALKRPADLPLTRTDVRRNLYPLFKTPLHLPPPPPVLVPL